MLHKTIAIFVALCVFQTGAASVNSALECDPEYRVEWELIDTDPLTIRDTERGAICICESNGCSVDITDCGWLFTAEAEQCEVTFKDVTHNTTIKGFVSSNVANAHSGSVSDGVQMVVSETSLIIASCHSRCGNEAFHMHHFAHCEEPHKMIIDAHGHTETVPTQPVYTEPAHTDGETVDTDTSDIDTAETETDKTETDKTETDKTEFGPRYPGQKIACLIITGLQSKGGANYTGHVDQDCEPLVFGDAYQAFKQTHESGQPQIVLYHIPSLAETFEDVDEDIATIMKDEQILSEIRENIVSATHSEKEIIITDLRAELASAIKEIAILKQTEMHFLKVLSDTIEKEDAMLHTVLDLWTQLRGLVRTERTNERKYLTGLKQAKKDITTLQEDVVSLTDGMLMP